LANLAHFIKMMMMYLQLNITTCSLL